MKRTKDWFNIKKYPHIGLPLEYSDRYKWIEPYVTNPNSIAKHRFLPFIHKTSRVKKFRKDYLDENGKLNPAFKKGDKTLRKAGEKTRELFYASHLDSLIYSYYSRLLSEKYEQILKSEEYNLDCSVTAYRSIPVNPAKGKGSNKCNIDFANDVFKEIINYSQKEFNVIAFDITSFFDNLDHKILREAWSKILNTQKLTPDHFNVYKNITRFSYVDIVDIFNEFKEKIYTRKINQLGTPLEIKQKKIDKVRFLRNQHAIAFCTKKEFLKVKGKLLQPSKTKKMNDGNIVYRNFGIPQGSPISSILANIYLLEFDKTINDFLIQVNGTYKRYSDDIVVICPSEYKEKLQELILTEIQKYKLEIQAAKTQVFHFKRENRELICGQEFEKNINWNKNLVYLGFEFDGQHVLLKSGSLSGYYRKMKRYIRKSKHHSNKIHNKNRGKVFKKRIFKKFSYKGAKRIRKRIWNEDLKAFETRDGYNYGNFLTYAYKASNRMVNNKIKNQTKRHWNILNELLK